MDGCEFNLAVSAVACGIAKGKSSEEIALLSCFFNQLGDSLATIEAANICFDRDNSTDSASSILPL